MNNTWINVKAGEIFENVTIKGHENEKVLTITQDRGAVYREDCGIDIKYNEDSLKSYKLVEEGNFVISLRSFQGGIEYSELRGIVSPAYTIIKSKVPINKDYFRYYFKSKQFINNLSKAVVGIRDGKQISYNVFQTLDMLVPPLNEQKSIAGIIQGVDKVINEIDMHLGHLSKLKKALAEKLLTEGIGHTQFEDSEIGKIPVGWKVCRLNEVCEINKYSLKGSTDEGRIIKYIDIESVNEQNISGYKEMSFGEAPSRARRIVKYGDVILSTVRPYLKAFAQVKFEDDGLVCSTGFAVIDTKNREKFCNEYFLQFALSDLYLEQLKTKMVGSNYPAVNSSDISESLVTVPDIDEQYKVAEILGAIDTQIQQFQFQKNDYTQLKEGLMQQLLTGKIRVKIEEDN